MTLMLCINLFWIKMLITCKHPQMKSLCPQMNLAKAYDCAAGVSWKAIFLNWGLQEVGCYIMSSVKMVSFSVLINGQSLGFCAPGVSTRETPLSFYCGHENNKEKFLTTSQLYDHIGIPHGIMLFANDVIIFCCDWRKWRIGSAVYQ